MKYLQMPINSIIQQKVNKQTSMGRRIACSAASAVALTSVVGTVYMVEGVYSTPKKEKESFIQHIMRDLGEDVKKRYTKFFDRISCSKLSQKVGNMKPSSLAGIWAGAVFSAFFAAVYLALGTNKNKKY